MIELTKKLNNNEQIDDRSKDIDEEGEFEQKMNAVGGGLA